MLHSNDDYRGLNLGSLEDPALSRFVDSQEAEWRELPQDSEFRHLEAPVKPKRFAKLRAKLKAVIAKARRQRRVRHAPQPA